MTSYRIELRSFNIGAGRIAGPDRGIGFPKPLADDLLDHAAGTTAHEAGLILQQGLNRLAGPAEFGQTPPSFANGAPKRVTEDGWVGPETQAAVDNHAAEQGLRPLREAVSLAALQRGLERLAKGEAGVDEAPTIFHRSVGRLFRNPGSLEQGGAAPGLAPPRPSWASVSQARPRHEDVSALQGSLNEANRIFGFAPEPLRIASPLTGSERRPAHAAMASRRRSVVKAGLPFPNQA